MMAAPAPNETALGHKMRSFLTMADMQFGEGLADLSALCADLWRMADLEQQHSDAQDWLDAFECFGGRWAVGVHGIEFFSRLEGSTDADLMMARRLETQLHAQPNLAKEVGLMILENAAEGGNN
ncbi:hypothetical protein [Sphingobium tyrosinilyticum]|uniref:Uncharacterized protein n=1 Tax=Sphingobium tyrosinilyticum TaxID=2715436 RepID=A0ABV9EXB9_9SPHN